MGEIGSGNNSVYPGDLDTNSIPEVNSPAAGKTKARKEVVEDLTAAVIAIETELGTDPAGSLANVKTYLQTDHQTDGTHKSDHGLHRWIDAGDYANFQDAINAAIGKTLVIATSVSLPAGAITIPATVLGVMPIAPGIISKGSATSLTINGPVVGGPMHQWLSGFGTNNLYFGSGAIDAFYVEWLGAISGSSANQATNGIALQNCLNIFVSNIMEAGTKAIPKIKLTGQYYYSGSGLTIATGAGEDIEMFVLEGEVGGIWSANTDPNLSFSRLHYTGTGYALTVGSYGICFARGCSFKNFALTGTSSALGGFNGDELHSSVLKNILITGFTATNAHGLKIKGIGNVSYSSSFYGNYNGALVERNYNTFYNCTFTN